MADAPALIINLPGAPYNGLPIYATVAGIRAIPSGVIQPLQSIVLDDTTLSEGALYTFDPASVLADDGVSVLKPNDLTPLQAGRWRSALSLTLQDLKGDPGGNVSAVGLFTSIAGMRFDGSLAGTDSIDTTGYRALGHGAARLLRFKAPMANLPALTAGANAWYTTAADGSIWYIDPFQIVDFDMFGAYGDDATDDYPAFLAMHQFCRWRSGWLVGDSYSLGGRVQVPARNYYSSQSWRIKTTLRLEGSGTGMAGGSEQNRNYHIRFPAGVDGIVVESYDTLNGATEATPTGGGTGTILDGLNIAGPGVFSTGAGHGVRCVSRATVRNCNIDGWMGDGIHCNSGDGGNCNGSIFENNRIIIIGGSGIFTSGGDGNACIISGNDISNIGRWGIEDRSFLNNHHAGNEIEGAGCVGNGGRTKPSMVSYGGNYYSVADGQDAAASTTVPGTNATVWLPTAGAGTVSAQFPAWVSGTAYAAGGALIHTSASAATFIHNLYVEPNCASIQEYGLGAFLGGDIQCNVLVGGPQLFRSGPGLAATASIGVRARSLTSSTNAQQTFIGPSAYSPTGGAILKDTHDVFTPNGMVFAHDGSGNLAWTDGGSGALVYYLTGPNTTIRGGAVASQGRVGLNGFLLHGGPSGPKLWLSGNGPPTTGTYALGDRVYNDGSGGNTITAVDFWYCSVAGTPGTWIAKA